MALRIVHAVSTFAAVSSTVASLLCGPANGQGDAAAPRETRPADAAPATALESGRWQGEIDGPQSKLFCLVELSTEGGTPLVHLTVPNVQAVRTLARDVVLKGNSLAFSLDSLGVTGRFRGAVTPTKVDEATSRATRGAFAGTLLLGRAGADPDEVQFSLTETPNPKSVDGAVRYETELDLGAAKLPMGFTIARLGPEGTPDAPYVGSVDIPMQGLSNYPVLVTRGTDESGQTTWTLRIPVGVDAILDLVEREGGTLRGRFRQAGMDFPVTLARSTGKVASEMRRPQMPKPPYPYTEREVTIAHRFGHSLAATFLVPERTADSPKHFPAVVLISGSGPQDRDESLLGHKPFLVLADALARAGIAVLRFDDRGVGASTGQFKGSTTFNFATDADEASEWLKRQPEIDQKRIGLIGHSEGAMIAPIVTAWQWSDALGSKDPIAYMALLAGPGVSGKEVLKVQMRRLLAAEGTAEEDAAKVAEAQARVLDLITAPDRDADAIRDAARLMAETQLMLLKPIDERTPPTEEELDAATNAIIAQLSDPWMMAFLTLDPRPWLAASPVPILAMNGELDTQVDADQNLPAIEEAVGRGRGTLTVKRYPGLNHLFQPATTGGVSEYATIETTFDPQALDDLVRWVVARAKEKPPTRTDLAAPPAPSARPASDAEAAPSAPGAAPDPE